MTYIGSRIPAFDWCQNHRPWMTLKGHYALSLKTHASFGAHHENLNEDRPTLSADATTISGGSRIWQGRVSNPSERGTGGAKAPTCAPLLKARAGGGSGARKVENLDTLIHFPGISGHYNLYD